MNDIIDSFIGAYKSGALDNYQEKGEPRKMDDFYNYRVDLEHAPKFTTTSNSTQNTSATSTPQRSSWNNITGKFSSASELLGFKKLSSAAQNRFSAFSYVDNSKSYTKAFICLGLGAILLMMAFMCLPMFILAPQQFTILFTLGIMAMLTSLAFLNGPRSYLEKVTQKQFIVPTGVLIGSMVFSLWFSLISGSYVLSLLSCIVEVSIC